MTEQEALLRAIIAEPDDDAPRLVYANWLEEHGDRDRAAFIRVQCELARLPEPHMSWLSKPTAEQQQVERRRAQLERRTRGLLRRHLKEWRQDIPDILYVSPSMFRRGFVETVHLSCEDFLKAPEQLWPLASMQTIHLVVGSPHDFERVCKAPRLALVTRLLISVEWRTPEEELRAVRAVAASRYVRSLTYLAVGTDDEGVKVLAASPRLPSLRRLVLSGKGIGPEGARALAESRRLRRLTYLELRFTKIGSEGALALAASATLANLTSLDVSFAGVRARGERALKQRFGDRVKFFG
jgi:uncharacterized protein (TIGR02996 family)